MRLISHAHGFAITAMVAAIVLMGGIGKTMYAEVTGWGGGQTLSAATDISIDAAPILRAAAPAGHEAPPDTSRTASPFMQLALALLLIVVGYALEVIRQEYAVHTKGRSRNNE